MWKELNNFFDLARINSPLYNIHRISIIRSTCEHTSKNISSIFTPTKLLEWEIEEIFFAFKSSHKTIICLQLWCVYIERKNYFFSLVYHSNFLFTLSHARLACMREIFASFTWKMIFLSFLLSRDADYIIFALARYLCRSFGLSLFNPCLHELHRLCFNNEIIS